MSDANEPAQASRQLLSDLVDGELDAAGCAQASALWAAGEAASRCRSTWHSYQLIGDVLRSEDLAQPPGRDEAFLQRLRVRLADEPAVLAPAPRAVPAAAQAARPRRRLPAALAAGVMGLGAALVAVQWSSAPPARPLAAAQPTPASAEPVRSTVVATPTVSAGGQVVRDARLDRYLRAHREYGSAAPVSLPGGAARTVETVSFQP
jgi:sigma-E factor negative regulatory protein RseA